MLYVLLRLTCCLLEFPHFMSQTSNLLLQLIAFVSRSALFAWEWCLWLGRILLMRLGPCSVDHHCDRRRRGRSVLVSVLPRRFCMLVWVFLVSLAAISR